MQTDQLARMSTQSDYAHLRIEGYAVVSDDDRIADSAGLMPDALKNDAEWAFFQAGLDAADVNVLGRKSHDLTPNHKNRRRLIMTRSVTGVELREDGVFWNSDGATLAESLSCFDCEVQSLAVAGGRDVFDYFLSGAARYSTFFLSRMHGVTLPDGVGVFTRVNSAGEAAEDILAAYGFEGGEQRVIDDGVSVVGWTPRAE